MGQRLVIIWLAWSGCDGGWCAVQASPIGMCECAMAAVFSSYKSTVALYSLLSRLTCTTANSPPPDYHQSLTPSYALQLRSFPKLNAAYYMPRSLGHRSHSTVYNVLFNKMCGNSSVWIYWPSTNGFSSVQPSWDSPSSTEHSFSFESCPDRED